MLHPEPVERLLDLCGGEVLADELEPVDRGHLLERVGVVAGAEDFRPFRAHREEVLARAEPSAARIRARLLGDVEIPLVLRRDVALRAHELHDVARVHLRRHQNHLVAVAVSDEDCDALRRTFDSRRLLQRRFVAAEHFRLYLPRRQEGADLLFFLRHLASALEHHALDVWLCVVERRQISRIFEIQQRASTDEFLREMNISSLEDKMQWRLRRAVERIHIRAAREKHVDDLKKIFLVFFIPLIFNEM